MKRKTLLILRHGKSDWTTGQEDFSRPLVARGQLGSQKIGAWIKSQKLQPDYVLSSPAARARGTTEVACQAMGLPLKKVCWDQRIYAAPVDALLASLADCPKNARCVMLVGHNPGLEELVHYLSQDPIDIPEDGKMLPTAALARLEFDAEWSKLPCGCAKVVSLTRAGELSDDLLAEIDDDNAKTAKNGAKNGNLVPGHFYTQSGVLPYRRKNGELQIMVVASRKGTRWVIPKGVRELELSLRDSAVKEAFEEAGIRGLVDEEPIGVFDYKKWDGVCQVTVFPLAVTECVTRKHWEESHRKRRWFNVKKVLKRIDEPGLRKLVKELRQRFDRH
ncbi:MAG TPA: histidine phosphatase family protein [Accumulibacter sp.]|jgi:phosphohistidine phosphatase|nr:histidine phosphatase family protein [Accumulibacter sp.]HQC81070.1 histidine phosphatase family protein [Accumulibacter sp.]